MQALASVFLIMTAFATQVAVEALDLNSSSWEEWTGLMSIVGMVGFIISIFRGNDA